VKRYNINGKNSLVSKELNTKFWFRLKDDLSISDTISSQDRLRTYSDGVLSINNIEPFDRGSYVCIISTLNSTNIRSKPAIITVKCKFHFYIYC
jgi:hypothetical protein